MVTGFEGLKVVTSGCLASSHLCDEQGAAAVYLHFRLWAAPPKVLGPLVKSSS